MGKLSDMALFQSDQAWCEMLWTHRSKKKKKKRIAALFHLQKYFVSFISTWSENTRGAFPTSFFFFLFFLRVNTVPHQDTSSAGEQTALSRGNVSQKPQSRDLRVTNSENTQAIQ